MLQSELHPTLPLTLQEPDITYLPAPLCHAPGEAMHCTRRNDDWSLDEETGTARAPTVEVNGQDQDLWWRVLA